MKNSKMSGKYSRGLLFSAFSTGILGTLSHAYQNTVLNNIEDLVKQFVNESLIVNYGAHFTSGQLTCLYSFAIVGVWALGGVLAGPLTYYVIEKSGRKLTLLVWNNLLVFLGSLCFILAKPTFRFEFLILGRLFFGAGLCVYLVSFALYITESAPDDKRGILSTYRYIFHMLSCLSGEILGLPKIMGTDELWPFLLALGFIPALMLFVLTPLLWETPKFLYIGRSNRDGAEKAVRYFHGNEVDMDAVFLEYDNERLLMSGKTNGILSKLRETWKLRHLRVPFILAILLNIGENTGGHDSILNYSSEIFEDLGLSDSASKIASICILIPGFFGAIFATFHVEKMGRRRLVLAGLSIALTGCFLLLCCEFIEDIWRPAAYGSLVGAALIIFAAYAGLCPIAEFIFGEITPEQNHAFVGSWAGAANFAATCFYSSTFSSLHDICGPWVQLYFIIPTVCIGVYTYKNLPETKGRPVDEIVATWIVSDKESDSELNSLITSRRKSHDDYGATE